MLNMGIRKREKWPSLSYDLSMFMIIIIKDHKQFGKSFIILLRVFERKIKLTFIFVNKSVISIFS